MLSFNSKKFTELTSVELYQILALRANVFIVEQTCPYQDVDGKDLDALHLLGYKKDNLIAYGRILKKGVSYKNHCSIGRIVIDREYRGKNYGHDLVNYAIKTCYKHHPKQSIKISAQAHLEKFYIYHRFIPTGEKYLEDDIPHIGMVLKD